MQNANCCLRIPNHEIKDADWESLGMVTAAGGPLRCRHCNGEYAPDAIRTFGGCPNVSCPSNESKLMFLKQFHSANGGAVVVTCMGCSRTIEVKSLGELMVNRWSVAYMAGGNSILCPICSDPGC